MSNDTEHKHRTNLIGWFGIEANARAVTTLIAVGVALGAIVAFLVDRVLPTVDPAWDKSSYAEGYRRGKKEAELLRKIQDLEGLEKSRRITEEIMKEISEMSNEEINKGLEDDFID